MRYKALVIFGVGLILLGYGLMESGGRVTQVTCERTEHSFLPVCHIREYFLGLFPSQPVETVTEITALSKSGKATQDFYLVQRLPNRKLAPVPLSKLEVEGRATSDEAMISIRRLSAFFSKPDANWVDVKLTNDAGSVPLGILFFLAGIALVLHQRITHERRKPKQTQSAVVSGISTNG